MGLLTSANAAGQLVFLPLLARLAQRYRWGGSVAVTLAVVAMLPVVALLLPETPADLGLGPYGAAVVLPPVPRQGNPFPVAMTIPPVGGAGILAALGVFSLIGSTLSGWLCDRDNPRVLLFWYYGLRGLSLILLPFTRFDVVSLSIFSIFYGLDWVATGPATFALTNELFGRRDTPVIVLWIFAGHQVGGAIAAFGAGTVRGISGDYLLAFLTSGLACLCAALLVLRVTRPVPAVAPAI